VIALCIISASPAVGMAGQEHVCRHRQLPSLPKT
jgi:hypothetical protein